LLRNAERAEKAWEEALRLAQEWEEVGER
jgi:hypothetical protein